MVILQRGYYRDVLLEDHITGCCSSSVCASFCPVTAFLAQKEAQNCVMCKDNWTIKIQRCNFIRYRIKPTRETDQRTVVKWEGSDFTPPLRLGFCWRLSCLSTQWRATCQTFGSTWAFCFTVLYVWLTTANERAMQLGEPTKHIGSAATKPSCILSFHCSL